MSADGDDCDRTSITSILKSPPRTPPFSEAVTKPDSLPKKITIKWGSNSEAGEVRDKSKTYAECSENDCCVKSNDCCLRSGTKRPRSQKSRPRRKARQRNSSSGSPRRTRSSTRKREPRKRRTRSTRRRSSSSSRSRSGSSRRRARPTKRKSRSKRRRSSSSRSRSGSSRSISGSSRRRTRSRTRKTRSRSRSGSRSRKKPGKRRKSRGRPRRKLKRPPPKSEPRFMLYDDLVTHAVESLDEEGGSCSANIIKYIMLMYRPMETPAIVSQCVCLSLREGAQSGLFKQRKGSNTDASGFFSLVPPEQRDAAKRLYAKNAKKPKRTRKPKPPPAVEAGLQVGGSLHKVTFKDEESETMKREVDSQLQQVGASLVQVGRGPNWEEEAQEASTDDEEVPQPLSGNNSKGCCKCCACK